MDDECDSRVASRHWYVIRCRSQKEARAAEGLTENLSVKTYLPEANVRSGVFVRRVPLFPGYIFAQADTQQVQRIGPDAAPGVMHVLRCDGRPQPVPDEVIDHTRRKLEAFNAQGFLPYHHFRPNDTVRVTSGPFCSIEAIFLGPTTPNARVTVLLQLVGRANEVQVDVDSLEPANSAPQVERPRRTRGKGRRIK